MNSADTGTTALSHAFTTPTGSWDSLQSSASGAALRRGNDLMHRSGSRPKSRPITARTSSTTRGGDGHRSRPIVPEKRPAQRGSEEQLDIAQSSHSVDGAEPLSLRLQDNADGETECLSTPEQANNAIEVVHTPRSARQPRQPVFQATTASSSAKNAKASGQRSHTPPPTADGLNSQRSPLVRQGLRGASIGRQKTGQTRHGGERKPRIPTVSALLASTQELQQNERQTSSPDIRADANVEPLDHSLKQTQMYGRAHGADDANVEQLDHDHLGAEQFDAAPAIPDLYAQGSEANDGGADRGSGNSRGARSAGIGDDAKRVRDFHARMRRDTELRRERARQELAPPPRSERLSNPRASSSPAKAVGSVFNNMPVDVLSGGKRGRKASFVRS